MKTAPKRYVVELKGPFLIDGRAYSSGEILRNALGQPITLRHREARGWIYRLGAMAKIVRWEPRGWLPWIVVAAGYAAVCTDSFPY